VHELNGRPRRRRTSTAYLLVADLHDFAALHPGLEGCATSNWYSDLVPLPRVAPAAAAAAASSLDGDPEKAFVARN